MAAGSVLVLGSQVVTRGNTGAVSRASALRPELSKTSRTEKHIFAGKIYTTGCCIGIGIDFRTSFAQGNVNPSVDTVM